ncbi:MAG: FixH family protein [Algoriphagus sp.]|uniref:FixH family protein n=1 Tax=Algoriphagus sp. TaxID=1872435 RepID=UPI00271B7AE5|nr:FixH family protein [Algoriphagus sp.]MDO8968641.1 FixH family protein [Algoriphagus sp.]MDP2039784.1 FixH family protein [Algoriphagus sp.]MDP3200337.1 FixH family protein [Algoriphagus sp.]MDP3471534.1 FixH family protein [Algoriphagus sp.]
MDWGKGILLTIIAFVGFILTLVVISVRQDDIHLVTENYYEKEIKYQDQIDRETSAAGLDREVLLFDSQSKSMVLDLPVGAKGNLQLFRPSDARLDQELALDIQEEGKTTVSLDKLKSGYWKVQLTWTENGTDFYQEKKISL